MTTRQALEHRIWQEENLQLFKPLLFNRAKLNKLKRQLHEIDHPPAPKPQFNTARAIWPPRAA